MRSFRTEARKFGFEVVSMHDDFEKEGWANLMVDPSDPIHIGRAGHELTAGKLLLPVLEHVASSVKRLPDD